MTIKKIFSLLLSVLLVFSITIPIHSVHAESPTPTGYVTMSVEVNTIGAGFLREPIKVPFYDGENYAKITDRFLNGISNYQSNGSFESGFYLSRLKLNGQLSINVPQIILTEMGKTNQEIINEGTNQSGFLGEFDYSSMSGWMYSVNNEFPNVGASDKIPSNGDVCRWQFTLNGYGADLGQDNSTWGGSPPLYSAANKDLLIKKVAEINSATNKAELLAKQNVLSAYQNAYNAINNLTIEQASVNSALSSLTSALSVPPPASNVDISTQLNASLGYILSAVPSPDFGTGSGEWSVLTLARGGFSVPDAYYSDYYNRVLNKVKSVTGVLSTSKNTEYSRLVLALSAIGKSPTNVGGYNMLTPLADYEKTISQGINGGIFALIALDTRDYEIPTNADSAKQATRQKYIDYILSKEVKKGTADAGGFALFGTTADPDITGMALQSLAPYQSMPEVKEAINRALSTLSKIQQTDGGFTAFGSTSSESIAQVIVALTSVGVDPATDSRFVKSGGNLVSALLSFYVDGGGFKHVLSGNRDGMATDQGTYALVAYDRFINGKNSLYDMMDDSSGNVETPVDPNAAITLDIPERIVGTEGTTFNAIVKTGSFPKGDFKLMDGVINIPDQIQVEDLVMSNRMTGGSVAWNYNPSDKKLRFVYTNTNLDNIGLSNETFPAELFTIMLKVKDDIDMKLTPKINISVGGITVKKGSDVSAFIFDISKASAEVAISNIAINMKELFAGDGIDIIPDDKKAIAVSIAGLPKVTNMKYKSNINLLFSNELTDKKGIDTYVFMVTKTEKTDDLLNNKNYKTSNGTLETIRFGDIDKNDLINAQDALDVISTWLRKTATPDDEKIMRLNVTSDSRINTFDALAIMENYVSQSAFEIVNK